MHERTETGFLRPRRAGLGRCKRRKRSCTFLHRCGSDPHPKTAGAENSIGTIHHVAGRLPEARAHYERARDVLEATLGPMHAKVAVVLYNLALIHRHADNISDARGLFRRVLEIREAVYGSRHVLVADALEEFAILEAEEGNTIEARTMFEEVLAIRRALHQAGHVAIWRAVENLATLNGQTGESAQSRALYAQLVAEWTEALGEDDLALARPLLAIAQMELIEGHPAAAVAPARRAVELHRVFGEDAVSYAKAQYTLAQALAPDPEDGATGESLALAREALAGFAGSPELAGSRASVKAWLAARGVEDGP